MMPWCLLLVLVLAGHAQAAPRLSVSPATVPPGGKVTVSWSDVTKPKVRDWISPYRSGGADAQFDPARWVYTSSCTQSPGTKAKRAGSCTITMSTTAGRYQMRLFANDGFTRLATSATVTVTAPPPPPPAPVTLEWDYSPQVGDDAFTIERCATPCGAMLPLVTLGIGDRHWIDTTARSDRDYCYQIRTATVASDVACTP